MENCCCRTKCTTSQLASSVTFRVSYIMALLRSAIIQETLVTLLTFIRFHIRFIFVLDFFVSVFNRFLFFSFSFVSVLVLINEFIIFSLLAIFVFVNENHTATHCLSRSYSVNLADSFVYKSGRSSVFTHCVYCTTSACPRQASLFWLIRTVLHACRSSLF